MKFSIISAIDEENGIGKHNDLAWDIVTDRNHFRNVTRGSVVVMGWNTWLSLPKRVRPMPKRLNVVLSFEEVELPEGVLQARSFESAFEQIETHYGNAERLHVPAQKLSEHGATSREDRKVFVIGGGGVYKQAIEMPECEKLYLTEVKGTHGCDIFFPEVDERVWEKIVEGDWQTEPFDNAQGRGDEEFRFCEWVRKL